MKGMIEMIQIILASIGAFLSLILGGWDGFLYALVVLVVLDYATGVMRAIIEQKLSSAIGFKGLFKKMLIFAMVVIGNIIDVHIIGSGNVVRTAVIFFYASNEGISILENASALGLPIPNKLKNVLSQIGEEEGVKDEEKAY